MPDFKNKFIYHLVTGHKARIIGVGSIEAFIKSGYACTPLSMTQHSRSWHPKIRF